MGQVAGKDERVSGVRASRSFFGKIGSAPG